MKDREENEKLLADEHPDNYLAFAILCTVVCFAPVGIFALFYSLRVNQYWASGNILKARRASIITRIICVWTIIAGIIFWIGILFGASYNIFGHKPLRH
ncbi:CD225/dispanin family protein [Apibacter adventoris]|uniref:CD225/dispanin family protein n=1 Tax=Apibacter adventoris TaxID=1679466 RepID=A0A2S8A7I4_9FLAO|nr:CD225/dispanin family protein [Apibacter adventoris]PQL90456.1 hypothetical protein C4S77_11225 [Apibacter adventoris]PQL96037.1 hypothetical protein C4S76_00670 [Apibacter adventoris]